MHWQSAYRLESKGGGSSDGSIESAGGGGIYIYQEYTNSVHYPVLVYQHKVMMLWRTKNDAGSSGLHPLVHMDIDTNMVSWTTAVSSK